MPSLLAVWKEREGERERERFCFFVRMSSNEKCGIVSAAERRRGEDCSHSINPSETKREKQGRRKEALLSQGDVDRDAVAQLAGSETGSSSRSSLVRTVHGLGRTGMQVHSSRIQPVRHGGKKKAKPVNKDRDLMAKSRWRRNWVSACIDPDRGQ